MGSGVYRWLKGKYFVDELYSALFIRPAEWIAATFTSLWMDRTVIDGILHGVAHLVGVIGAWLRNFIDKPIVNGLGDLIAESTKRFGGVFRTIQTGRVQQYMILALVSVAVVSVFFYYFLILR